MIKMTMVLMLTARIYVSEGRKDKKMKCKMCNEELTKYSVLTENLCNRCAVGMKVK